MILKMATTDKQTTAGPAVVQKKEDFVKKDGVIKEQVCTEERSKDFWQRKWNFLNDFYQICIEEAAKEGLTEEQFNQFRRKKKPSKYIEAPGYKFVPSENFPITSSGVIGWRSSRTECTLEIFGPLYVSPRHTMCPSDRPNTPPQNFIYLG